MHEPSSYYSTGGNNGGYTIADDSDGSNSKKENQEEDRYGTERDGDQKQDEDQYGRDWDRNDGEIDQSSRVDNYKDDYTKDHEQKENRYSLQTADDKPMASHRSYDGDHDQSFDHDDHHSSRSVEEKGDEYSMQDRDHIERQSLGPSSLGGDEIYTALSLGDVETQSQQRILAFAAKRCANAVQKNPQDYDALYNWALVLQESADNINGDTVGNGKDQLLEEACEKYKAATDICPTLHEAFYNWAIAISDRAKVRGRTKEAEDLWKQACQRYERAVHFNRNSPQAFNNWGLALQELSGIVSIKNKRSIVKTAIKKFRAAITLQFDFHRAIYNLGTVLYGLAEDTIRSGTKDGNSEELTAAELYSQSAIYVAAAHALKPEYPVYKSALRLVRSKLPLAYLKTGYLVVPPEGDILAPHNDWKRSWFVLDHEAIYQVDRTGTGSSQSSPMKAEGIPTNHSSRGTSSYTFRIDIADICGLNRSADLSLPPGAAFEIDTVTGPKYLIANSWEEVDCWVDAVRLVFTIYSRGQSEVLGGIIAG